VGTTTRAIALVAAVGVLILVLVLALTPRETPDAFPDAAGPGGPSATAAGATSDEPPATGGEASPAATAVSGPTEEPVAVLVGAGDIAECSEGDDEETAALVESVGGIVFTLGDNAYEKGTFAEFQDCYGPTWGRPSILDRTMPVVGNHEYETRDAQGYFRYFGSAAGDPEEGWYAYDAGAWRIYVLNSNCAEVGGCEVGSAQERWLRGDLVANPRPCSAAMWHHPRFSSGEHGNHEFMADLWQTLQDARTELVLTGHDHSYERFGPQDASGRADERGLVELVVGTGGRDPRGFGDPLPNSLVRESPVFGVMRLVLGVDGYAFEFLAVPGEDFTDRGTGACH
jgi:3',5'-cyclic AMP phosphodiesterase CpdA